MYIPLEFFVGYWLLVAGLSYKVYASPARTHEPFVKLFHVKQERFRYRVPAITSFSPYPKPSVYPVPEDGQQW